MNEKQNNMMLMGQLIEERHYSLLMSTCPITASFKVKLNIIQNTIQTKTTNINYKTTNFKL